MRTGFEYNCLMKFGVILHICSSTLLSLVNFCGLLSTRAFSGGHLAFSGVPAWHSQRNATQLPPEAPGIEASHGLEATSDAHNIDVKHWKVGRFVIHQRRKAKTSSNYVFFESYPGFLPMFFRFFQ